jgi:uncharacterized repeat protein (TIGR03803 family)
MKTKFLLIFILGVSITTQAQFTKLFDFAGTSNGSMPYGSLISDGTFFYGTTYGGGTNGYGTVFKIMPDGSNYTRLFNFDNFTSGGLPCGSLLWDGNFLYGTAKQGGVNSSGVIFKLATNGTGFQVLYGFPASTLNGITPLGDLITDGTFLYGATSAGGASNYGVIFKIKPDGTQYTVIHEFLTSGTGFSPGYGGLLFDGTFLYGMTTDAGTGGVGTIYKTRTDGTEFTTLFIFTSITGQYPSGSLISDGNFLYGTTNSGGSFGSGVAFKIKPDGTGFTKIINFISATKGSYPVGSLSINGTNLYGLTYSGGTNDMGVIYKVNPDGTNFTRLFDFNGAIDGKQPNGSLYSDGIGLYGMTMSGGATNNGVVFKYDTNTGIENSEQKSEIEIFPNPFTNELVISSTTGGGEVVLYDITGKEIFGQTVSSEETVINTGKIASGFYVLNVGGKNFKVVKN